MAVSLISKLWTKISHKRAPQSIMIIGLDNSGKTSILNCLANLNSTASNISSKNLTNSSEAHHHQHHNKHQDNEHQIMSALLFDVDNVQVLASSNIMPTAGYNYERIQYKGLTLTVLDFSGQNRYRNLWQEFYNSVDGIVFVIDSSDLIRLVVARDELETMLNHPYFTVLDTNQHQSNDSMQLTNEPLSLTIPRQTTTRLVNSNLVAQKQITISQGKLIQSPLETFSSTSINSGNITKTTTIGCGAGKSGNIKNQNNQQKRSLNQSAKRRTKVPILFLANKTDLANSVDTEVITKALNLNQLSTNRHPWFIRATSVNSAQGIVEGFDWLVREMSTSIE